MDVYYEDIDNPPSVSVAVNPATARVGDFVRVVAAATDDWGVRSIEFFEVDASGFSRRLITLRSPPYAIDTVVPSSPQGVVYYMARATDTSGQYRDSRLAAVTLVP